MSHIPSKKIGLLTLLPTKFEYKIILILTNQQFSTFSKSNTSLHKHYKLQKPFSSSLQIQLLFNAITKNPKKKEKKISKPK